MSIYSKAIEWLYSKPLVKYESRDDKKDVHTEHCCSKHGCKYSYKEKDCTVYNGILKQSFECDADEDMPCKLLHWDFYSYLNEHYPDSG